MELMKAKNAVNGNAKEKIKKEMLDVVFGVMIMQRALVEDFGKGFPSVIGFIKAKRELKKYQNLLKGLVR
jgi:NTP pyrophosphatase (non-canonical NTP hydrolase)